MVEAAYLGDASAGASLIHPLRRLGPELDTFGSIPAPALGQLHMDPDQPVPAAGDGVLLADALAAAIDTLVALTGPPTPTTPLLSIESVTSAARSHARPPAGVPCPRSTPGTWCSRSASRPRPS